MSSKRRAKRTRAERSRAKADKRRRALLERRRVSASVVASAHQAGLAPASAAPRSNGKRRSDEPRLGTTPAAMQPDRRRPRTALSWHWWVAAAALLAVATVLVYAGAVRDALVFDDKFFFPKGRSLTLAELGRIFSQDAWEATGTRSGVYRPLTLLSILLDSTVYGATPAALHATNVALHVTAVLLLFSLLAQLLDAPSLRQLVGPRPWPRLLGAFGAALIFATHPIHSEAVNSIFNRSELLVGVLGLATLWALWRFEARRPVLAWSLAALGSWLGLLAKESALAVPPVALLLVMTLRPAKAWRARLRRLRPALLLVAALALYVLMRWWALGSPFTGELTEQSEPSSLSAAARLSMTASGLVEAWRMLVWPHPLLISYKNHELVSLGVALLVHAALITAALYAWRRNVRVALFSLLSFCLALLPSSRLFTEPAISVAVAERYLYFASTMVALAVAVGLAAAASRLGVLGPAVVPLLLALVLGRSTMARTEDWASEVLLYEAEYRAAPGSEDATRLIVVAYTDQGRNEEAVRICDDRLREHPKSPKLGVNCGNAYDALGRFADAERAYLQATSVGGIGAAPFGNLGRLYARTGRREEAVAQFLAAADAEVVPAARHARLAQMWLLCYPDDPDKLRQAIAESEQALRLQPNLSRAQKLLGDAQRRLRKLEGK